MVSKCFLIECGQKIKFPKVESGVNEIFTYGLGDRFVVFASLLHKYDENMSQKKIRALASWSVWLFFSTLKLLQPQYFHIIDMMLLSKYPRPSTIFPAERCFVLAKL